MLTTAGVIFLRTGASVGIPLACSITGSGTLACAAMIPPVARARPSAVAPNIRFMAPILRGQIGTLLNKMTGSDFRSIDVRHTMHALDYVDGTPSRWRDRPDSLALYARM